MVWLEAHDGSIVFDLMGGRNIVDRRAPEAVHMAKDGISGLVPPWRTITQKGGSQDGATFIDALYDPCEVTLDLIVKGRDAAHCRVVTRDLLASIDAKRKSKLHMWTQQQGHWWSDVRWFKTLPGTLSPSSPSQVLKLPLLADDAFWRTAPSVDSFVFSYAKLSDSFEYVSGSAVATMLGTSWPLRYEGTGGYIATRDNAARWVDYAAALTQNRSVVVGPYKGFSTATDNQVVTIKTGGASEPALPESAYNDLWVRMGRNANGTWNGYGVRCRIGWGYIEIARFNNFVRTVLATQTLWVPPSLTGDEWRFVAGTDANPRMFTLYRNGFDAFHHLEAGTGSALGATYRGVGFGMQASAALVTQATPAPVKRFSAGDNVEVDQAGYLRRCNPGDQPMHDTYTVFGPGTFRFWLGPDAGADDYVEFGPLLPNQVVHINADPRKRSVRDLSSVPATAAEMDEWSKALSGFLDFVGAGTAPLIESIKSQWGITPPQGNLYSLLKGRWSDKSAIPARSPGGPLREHVVKVSIEKGTASSKIIASGTPLLRYPL